jgi:hypothetical protein
MTLAELNSHPDYQLKSLAGKDPVAGDAATPDANGLYPQLTPEQVEQKNIALQNKLVVDTDTCQLKKNGGLYKTHIDAANCLNQAVGRAASGHYYPWPDLLNSLNTFRTQLAADVDAKKITEENFDFKLADKLTELTTQEINRKAQFANMAAQQQSVIAQRQAAFAAQQSARAQALSALAQQQAAQAQQQTTRFAPTPVAPMPRSTNCTTNAIGQTLQTNCTGY